MSLMKVEKVPDSTYDMIGGLDQQIKEIKEVIELPIKHPELFEALGVAQPKACHYPKPPGLSAHKSLTRIDATLRLRRCRVHAACRLSQAALSFAMRPGRGCCCMVRRARARRCWRGRWRTTRTAPSSGCPAASSCRSTSARAPAWSASSSSWRGALPAGSLLEHGRCNPGHSSVRSPNIMRTCGFMGFSGPHRACPRTKLMPYNS